MSNKSIVTTQPGSQAQGMVVQAMSPWKDIIRPELEKASPMLIRLAPNQFKKQVEDGRLLTALLAATKKTPSILACDPKSIVLAMAQAASVGIIPGSLCKHADFIPYGPELQFQLRYAGLVELAMRTGRIAKVRGVSVYEADEFILEEGTEDRIIHRPALKNRGTDANIIGAYGVVKYRDGSTQFRWLDRDALDKRKAKSQGGGTKGPWKDWFKEMCDKTGIKYVLSQASLSDTEESEVLGKALAHDDGEPIDVSEHYDMESDVTPQSTAVAGSLAAQAQ